MAGSPIRRARREGLPSPSAPRVLPASWAEKPRSEQFEWLLDASLDQALQVMTWNVDALLPYQLAIWDRVRADLWKVGLGVGIFAAAIARKQDEAAEEAFALVEARLAGDDGQGSS